MGLDGISAPLQKLISPATLESFTKVPNCSILSGTCPSQCRQTATCYARSQIWTSFWSERFSSDFQLFRSCLKDTYIYPFNAGLTSTGLPLWEIVIFEIPQVSWYKVPVALSPFYSGALNSNFRENICWEDDLRSRIFGAFVVKFLAFLPLLGFSNIYKMV